METAVVRWLAIRSSERARSQSTFALRATVDILRTSVSELAGLPSVARCERTGGPPSLAPEFSARAMVGILRCEFPERRMVPLRRYEQGWSVRFTGTAA